MKRLIRIKNLPAVVALLLLAATGCDRDKVKVYHVENSAAPAPSPVATPAPATMPVTMPVGLPSPDNSRLPLLKYVLPDGWKEKAPSQMRVASFEVSDHGKIADVSVIPLGGMAGGAAANVTRWRGQVGLPPVTEDEAAKLAEKISVGDQPADLFDLNGGAQRILAASFHRDDTEWFFKMTGDAALVEAQKPAFISFLKTIQFVLPAQ
jgi:hypothetical protein